MEKNTILAIILSSLVIIIGFSIQGYFYPPAAVNADQTAADSLPEETVSASVTEMVPFTESGTETPENGIAEEEFFTVETDLVKVTFTNRGGDIVSYLLKETAMNGGENPSEQFIEMADFTSESNRAFSLIFGDADGAPVDRIFNVRRISDTSIGFFAEFQGKDSNGSNTTFVLAKQYTFQPDDYMFELAVSVEDVLARRVRALFVDARAAVRMAPKVASIMAKELGETTDWEAAQVASFTALAHEYMLS